MTACQPRAITTASNQTNGTKATRNEATKKAVATSFLTRRRTLRGRNNIAFTGCSSAVVLDLAHPLTFPPAIARAAALTMKVSTNNANPAEIYAPVGSGSLNSEAAEAILEANV